MSLFRNPVPDGSLGPDNKPLTILPENTILKRKYKVSYHTTGGMGIIYIATLPDKKCIIKEVDASQPKLVIALNQEKNTLERLEYDGIVKVYDFFEEEGYYYLVLEWVEGKTLTQLLPSDDTYLSEKAVVSWAIQICDIFDYLHNLNPPIIYRDLKPDNIMIETKTGKIKLIDFGVARVFKKGKSTDTDCFGSVATASPEHYGGAQTDARSDIFTLGATINYLLTNGKGQTTDDLFIFHKIQTINKDVSSVLDDVVTKALSLDPEDRYNSVKEFKQALLSTQPHLADELRPKPIETPKELKKKKEEIIISKFHKTDEDRKKGRLVITLVIILLILAISIALLLGRNILFPSKITPEATPKTTSVTQTVRTNISIIPLKKNISEIKFSPSLKSFLTDPFPSILHDVLLPRKNISIKEKLHITL